MLSEMLRILSKAIKITSPNKCNYDIHLQTTVIKNPTVATEGEIEKAELRLALSVISADNG